MWVYDPNSSHAGCFAILHRNVSILLLYQGYAMKSIVLSNLELVSGRRIFPYSLFLEQATTVLSLHSEGITAWEESEQFKVTLVGMPCPLLYSFSLPHVSVFWTVKISVGAHKASWESLDFMTEVCHKPKGASKLANNVCLWTASFFQSWQMMFQTHTHVF